MQTLKGNSVCNGIACGKIFFINKSSVNIERKPANDIPKELNRLENAVTKGIEELEELRKKTEKSADADTAGIFDTHILMLSDDDFTNDIKSYITENKVCAEYAVSEISKKYVQLFRNMDNAYLRERSRDVADISERLINILSDTEYNSLTSGNVIIAADDLSPSETVGFDREHVMGFILKGGSATSHTSILAKTMNIPAIINIGDALTPDYDGKTAYIDGSDGKIYIEPDTATTEMLENKRIHEKMRLEELNKLKGKPNITKNSKEIMLFANITTSADVDRIIDNDARGIGLLRSEFLYMDRKTLPSENELFEMYKSIAEKMDCKPVIIRTLDIGADKKTDALDLPYEENPALGWRAIRICLERTDIFETQLRAIYRASAYGNIYTMLPMIISVDEVVRAKEIIKKVCSDLKAENIPFKEIPIGIMIETPAAAIISDKLAKHVDFFSVGTNDLTQYTLAADRQNPHLSKLYTAHHTAILRLIKLAADNIHKEGKWIGICGEAAADNELLKLFIAIGIDEFSVSSGYLLPVKELILNTDLTGYTLPDELNI